MNDCQRAGRLIGGCNFEARYDRIPPTPKEAAMYILTTPRCEILTRRIYVRDVCTRCGKTIERGAK
jgi:hypothetical protein